MISYAYSLCNIKLNKVQAVAQMFANKDFWKGTHLMTELNTCIAKVG